MTGHEDLRLPEPDEAAYRAARQRLERRFDDVRVGCGWVDGPWGRVFLAASARGLCRVSFRASEDEFLDGLERDHLLPERAPERVAGARRELEEYFAGARRRFEVPVDLRGVTPFQRRVLEAATGVPFGQLASYGELARRIRSPGASRAVGGALGRNPVAIVVPCHRIVATGGGPGGYTGGLPIKRALLRIEGVAL